MTTVVETAAATITSKNCKLPSYVTEGKAKEPFLDAQSGLEKNSKYEKIMNGPSTGLSKSSKVAPFPSDSKNIIDAASPIESSQLLVEEVSESNDLKDGDEWFHGDSDLLSKDGTDKKISLSTDANEGQTFSVGSHGGGSTPGSTTTRPLLYSAIGSLENPHATSLGSLKKRLLAKNGKAALIPPLSLHFESGKLPMTNKACDSDVAVQKLSNPLSNAVRKAKNGKEEKESQYTDDPQEKGKEDEIVTKDIRETEKAFLDKSRKPSNLRNSVSKGRRESNKNKKVSYQKDTLESKKPLEMFRPSCDAYTPRIEKKKIKYKATEARTPVQHLMPMGTLQRPNFKDALRRVAMIIHQHIVKIERRFEGIEMDDSKEVLFRTSMRDAFAEENFCTPTYKCTMVRIPMARPGMVFGQRKIKMKACIPTEREIYEFAHQLFKAVQLSSECSIVCLIYVERLMESAKVPLLACTWKPIFMCGLLLASKVWQDLSSWNIEFASVYPQFSLDSINKLELHFLRNVKWDLYISSSLYAKYYFALRSIVEKQDFRQRYNRMVGRVDSVAQSEALKIQKRSSQVKEEAISKISRSM